MGRAMVDLYCESFRQIPKRITLVHAGRSVGFNGGGYRHGYRGGPGFWNSDLSKPRWQKRDLLARRYVYVWADGVYLQARMREVRRVLAEQGREEPSWYKP
jgi:hypothetical protein